MLSVSREADATKYINYRSNLQISKIQIYFIRQIDILKLKMDQLLCVIIKVRVLLCSADGVVERSVIIFARKEIAGLETGWPGPRVEHSCPEIRSEILILLHQL